MASFADLLQARRPILMDGAMGSELLRRGATSTRALDLPTINLTHPNLVREIHQSYVDAGAECLLTNTFLAPLQADPVRQSDMVQAGLRLARSVAGERCFVVGSLGPLEREEPADIDSAVRAVRLLADADALLLETQLSTRLTEAVCQRWAELNLPIPLLVSFTFVESDWKTTARHRAAWAEEHRTQVAALGVNCGRELGPDEIRVILQEYRRLTGLPLLVRPNAGTPRRCGDKWVYPTAAEEMARQLPEWIDVGATLIGGCCGTTPDHIAAFRRALGRRASGLP